MELKEITQFRKRFGDKIPDSILGLLYERYSDSINHGIGRELINDVLFTISSLINEIAKGNEKRISELGEYKKIADKWNGIIREHGVKIEDNYESNLLNYGQKVVLLRWLTQKSLSDASKTFINLNKFYHAYNSEIGEILRKDIEVNVNGGIKNIWENKVNGELVIYNAYRVIKTHWNTKIESHKKMKEGIQLIINRRKKDGR
jgi:hypothetical protein